MPFGEYADFADCVKKNKDKKSPEGYCATIQRKVEGESLKLISFEDTHSHGKRDLEKGMGSTQKSLPEPTGTKIIRDYVKNEIIKEKQDSIKEQEERIKRFGDMLSKTAKMSETEKKLFYEYGRYGELVEKGMGTQQEDSMLEMMTVNVSEGVLTDDDILKKINRLKEGNEKRRTYIDEVEDSLKVIEDSGVLELKLGPNTQEIGKRGFKNGLGYNDFKKTPLGKKLDLKELRQNQRVVLKNPYVRGHYGEDADKYWDFKDDTTTFKEFNEALGGKTLINYSITKDVPENTQNAGKQIVNVWNMLSDEDRSGITQLNVKYTENYPKDNELGHWMSATEHDAKVKGEYDENESIYNIGEITITLGEHKQIGIDKVIDSLLHEVAHNRLDRMKEENPEIVAKFQEDIIKYTEEHGAATGYADSYYESYKKALKDADATIRKKIDIGQLPKDTNIENAIKDDWFVKLQAWKVATETHSALFGYINSPEGIFKPRREYFRVKDEHLKPISDIMKKTLYPDQPQKEAKKKPEHEKRVR